MFHECYCAGVVTTVVYSERDSTVYQRDSTVYQRDSTVVYSERDSTVYQRDRFHCGIQWNPSNVETMGYKLDDWNIEASVFRGLLVYFQ